MPWLINAAQLDKFRKSQKNLIILDASFHLDQRDAKQEFIDKHIIDAQFFDIHDFSDPHTSLPHMLLQDEKIVSEKLSQLGIRNDYKIIIYDNSELHSASRALWMLKMFGHNPHLLYILDGGFKAWETYGGKTESGLRNISSKPYKAEMQTAYVRTLEDIKNNLKNSKAEVVDMRHPVRYAGGKEAREGVRSGHIPGSFCAPYFIFFDKDEKFLPLDKIKKKLSDLNIDIQKPIITTCGSGITGAILNFILDILSLNEHALYDGAWAEYGAETLYPGETGLDERPIETCVDN
jgi:thiosulfate/3-mercaptopyruvate sulfurtransferase